MTEASRPAGASREHDTHQPVAYSSLWLIARWRVLACWVPTLVCV